MGNAVFWYYPEPTGTVRKVDFGESLSDLQRRPVVDQAAVESIQGSHFSTLFSGRSMLDISLENFTNRGVAYDVEAMFNHLRRGGTVSFAEDEDKAVAGYAINNPAQGDLDVVILGRPWNALNPAAALVSPDVVVLQSPSPTYKYETHQLGAVPTPDSFALAQGARFDYTEEQWVLFRHRGFWPLLRLPIAQRNQRGMTHNHRITRTFDATFEEHVASLDLFYNVATGIATDGSDGSETLETVSQLEGQGAGFGGAF